MAYHFDVDKRLKPCPFCGGGAILKPQGNEHTKKYVMEVGCSTQGCTVSLRVGSPKGHATLDWVENKAIERWNKRVIS